MEKVLSICVPTYNMEFLLSRCLESFVIERKYMEKMEIIVVNDGSKDQSSIIAHRFAEKYPNTFIVVDKPNGNYGSCINAALKIATGKYFRICDADDKYEKCNLVDYIIFLENVSTDIVFSPYSTLNFDEEIKEFTTCPNNLEGLSVDINDVNWSDREIMRLRAMHCIATKLCMLLENNYVQSEGISYTDTQFSFYSLLYSKTCSFFEKNIYQYYLGRDGQTMSIFSMRKSHLHFYLNADKMINTYCDINYSISNNKRVALLDCIFIEALCFVDGFLGNFVKTNKQISALKLLIEKSNKSYNPCPLEDYLLSHSMRFKFWRKYKIPAFILYILIKIKEIFKR